VDKEIENNYLVWIIMPDRTLVFLLLTKRRGFVKIKWSPNVGKCILEWYRSGHNGADSKQSNGLVALSAGFSDSIRLG
jgi:hypothetical protein